MIRRHNAKKAALRGGLFCIVFEAAISGFGLLRMSGRSEALQPGLHRGSGHGQIQPDIALSVACKQAVAALQQDAGFVGKEVRQVLFFWAIFKKA